MVSPNVGCVPVPSFTAASADRLLNGLDCVPLPAAAAPLSTNQTIWLTPPVTPPIVIVTWPVSVRFGVTVVFVSVYQKVSVPS